jgi:hypothetical protein
MDFFKPVKFIDGGKVVSLTHPPLPRNIVILMFLVLISVRG